jgi:hypothetical protein
MSSLSEIVEKAKALASDLEGDVEKSELVAKAKEVASELEAEVTRLEEDVDKAADDTTAAPAAPSAPSGTGSTEDKVEGDGTAAPEASTEGVDANPNPAPGTTPEGSTTGPQPTEGGNVNTGEATPAAGVETPPADVQTSSDLNG